MRLDQGGTFSEQCHNVKVGRLQIEESIGVFPFVVIVGSPMLDESSKTSNTMPLLIRNDSQ